MLNVRVIFQTCLRMPLLAGAGYEEAEQRLERHGQNAVAQARVFTEQVGVTGIALTKLDGTARGGVVVAVERELNIPVKLIGTGEGVGDLIPFVPSVFVDAILEDA